MKKSMTLPDCWSDDRRMKVLFSPLRQRDVNPENYDGQIRFWKGQIVNYARAEEHPVVNLSALRNAFERNGEKPHCLADVLMAMMAAGEIKPMDQFMQDPNASWWERLRKQGTRIIRESLFSSPQAVGEMNFVIMDVVNSQADEMIKSLKNEIISRADIKKRLKEWKISENALPLVLFELECRQKVVKHHLQNDLHEDGSTTAHDDDERIVLKFGTETHKAFPFTDIELSIHKLEYTEKNLEKMIGQMEEKIHEHEEEAKRLLGEKKRVLAKNSLRKRDSTMKRLEKRVQCLENVQTLIQRIHDVTEDATVLDAYRTGTKSLQVALSKSGITLDTVDEAIHQMQDVIELHDEIKSAIATGGGAAGVPADDAELEKELEDLIAEEEKDEKSDKEGKVTEITKEDKEQDIETDLIDQLENLEIANDPLPSPAKRVKEAQAMVD